MQSHHGPLSLRFGQLDLQLVFDDSSSLLEVDLPAVPPHDLTAPDLYEALETLRRFRVAEPQSSSLHAFRTAVQNIPSGSTTTYGALAATLSTGARGVAARLAANRLLLLVPCHRVVAQTGLGGFRRGLGWKRKLLELESTTPSFKFTSPGSGLIQ